MNIIGFLKTLKTKTVDKVLGEKLSRTDLGVLKVAFMVAALDGDVTDDEYAAFSHLAKRCRGYTQEAEEMALEAAMRSAGYLMLLSRRVDEAALVEAFVREAESALPGGFAYLSIEDVRRAVVTWIAMGMSDGDYSSRERACIEALRRRFAELKVTRSDIEAEQMAALTPAVRPFISEAFADNPFRVSLVTTAFSERVETLIGQLGDSDAAASELEGLIANGKM